MLALKPTTAVKGLELLKCSPLTPVCIYYFHPHPDQGNWANTPGEYLIYLSIWCAPDKCPGLSGYTSNHLQMY